jgi:uncharacterized protein (DUF2062 family)
MQLSDVEKKMVARLIKRKQTFIRLRWLLLFTGVFNVGIGIFCFVILLRCLHLAQLDSTAAVIVALAAPLVYFFIWVGTYILADTLIHWHGRPEVDLLLRLIENSRDIPDK